MEQDNLKPITVWLILNGKTEEALTLLAKNYKVAVPNFKVGLPKGHKITAYGCYTAKNQTISVLNSDILANPFVIIHEFYHHLRSKGVDKMHRGTEENADKFALRLFTRIPSRCEKSSEPHLKSSSKSSSKFFPTGSVISIGILSARQLYAATQFLPSNGFRQSLVFFRKNSSYQRRSAKCCLTDVNAPCRPTRNPPKT